MTTTQAPPRLRSASLEKRLAAFLLDSVLHFSFALIFFSVGGLQLLLTSHFGRVDPPASSNYAFFFITLSALPAWVILTAFLWLWRGQTPGKRIVNIRIVQPNGHPPNLTQVLLRLTMHPT